ncbi:MAG: NAD(P)-dependent alcohol dehydrogenase [bacterium]|nr:NAD(P)-dependent alcohol dehydrogenase [bacterium]
MKAITLYEYGGPEKLKFEDVDKPVPNDDEVLVEVKAASLNIADWHMMTGTPYMVRLMGSGFRRPKSNRVGKDVSGVVEAVGNAVTRFEPGDEVFGEINGSFAEYAVAKEKWLVKKPSNVSHEEAAAVPLAGFTALQGLRDHGQLQPGGKVLINGASGAVGTWTVQIAKAMGAEVTAVCSTHNVEAAREMGADHVVDYTKDDFAKLNTKFDVMVDNVGNRKLSQCRDLLVDGGRYVMVSGPKRKWLGPMGRMLAAQFIFMRRSQKFVWYVANVNLEDLEHLRDLVEQGEISAVIDRRYSLSEVPDAFRYLGEGHARAKLVVTV